MSFPGPERYSVGVGSGVAATNPITVGSIRSGNVLLAVWSHAAGSAITGHAITDFTIGTGTITAGTIDTSNRKVVAVWS